MTLIEMVRKARENGHKWVAVDKDCSPYSYKEKPTHGRASFIPISKYEPLEGTYNLTCNWKDSLIDITKLKGIK